MFTTVQSIMNGLILLVLTFTTTPSLADIYSCNTIFQDFQLTANEYNVLGIIQGSSTLPEHIYEKASPTEVARALVYRVRTDEQRFGAHLNDRKDQGEVNLYKQSQIILFFKPEHTAGIAKEGFLNQHQTGRSNGMNNSKLRMMTEDLYSGIKLGESISAKKLRAKSAFLNITKDDFLGSRTTAVDTQFGSFGAVFKDYVKDQSMWTGYNSLEVAKKQGLVGATKSLTAGLINRCSKCIVGKELVNAEAAAKHLLPFRGTFNSGRIMTDSHPSYHEALIFGEVTFKDVDHFIVTNPFEAHRLVKFGKPIYSARAINYVGRVLYEKDQLMFTGTEPANSGFNKMLGF